MDAVRYYTALILLIAFPPALLGWLVIHPLAGFWRRRGPTITYAVVVGLAVSMGVVLFRLREPLLRVEFGFNSVLTTLGLVSLACSILLEHHYRRHLSIGTLLGLPELSTRHQSKLIKEGIYARIRHPRYTGLLFEILAFALFVNYLATYVVVVAAVPLLYLIVLLEELEMLDRFGAEFEHYVRQVPRFIPRLGRPKS